MTKKYILGLVPLFLSLMACSPIKMPVSNQYQINAFSEKKLSAHTKKVTLWVTPPEASAGYQTEQMMYVEKPYQLEAFSKNAWSNPPAEMLYPLIVQSLQKSGSFKAVLSSSYSQGADYRLDTQLLKLKQNFLKRPSVLEFSAKVVLLRMEDNRVIASKVFSFNVPCSENTPYGGVVAANQASVQFTAQLSSFLKFNL